MREWTDSSASNESIAVVALLLSNDDAEGCTGKGELARRKGSARIEGRSFSISNMMVAMPFK